MADLVYALDEHERERLRLNAERRSAIYRITGPRCVYIGQAKDPVHRWRTHRNDARRGKKTLLCDALRAYGPDAFRIEIVAKCVHFVKLGESCADASWLESTIIAQEVASLGKRTRLLNAVVPYRLDRPSSCARKESERSADSP